MKKLLSVLFALMMVLALCACGETDPVDQGGEEPEVQTDIFAKGEGVMTHDEYTAAADDTAVVIEGFVQKMSYAKDYGNCNIYLQDKDGGYYVYRMPCTDEDAAKLTVGTKIKVTGTKGSWEGEMEIAEGTAAYEVLEGTYTAEAADITDVFATDAAIDHMNELVAIKGLTVAASQDADGNDVAFTYGWGGSAAKGDNADLYFNVTLGEATYNLCVESDEFAEGSDVYTAVEALQIGQVIDVEAFLYWYGGPNPHVSAVKVAE